MKEKIVVKQNEEKPEPVEVLAESIVAISVGMRKIRAGKLNERALLVLLKDATNVPLYEIQKVLNGLDSLESKYLKKKSAAK